MIHPVRLLIAGVAAILSAIGPARADMGLMAYMGFGELSNYETLAARTVSGNDLSSPMEQACLATAIYHEARGEPVTGQLAVGLTVLNRVRSKAYPASICGVVFQNAHLENRCQFSFACDRLSDHAADQDSYEVARQLAGYASGLADLKVSEIRSLELDAGTLSRMADFTHYHRYDISPSWSPKLDRQGRIGAHVFLASRRVTRGYRSGFSHPLKPVLDRMVVGRFTGNPHL